MFPRRQRQKAKPPREKFVARLRRRGRETADLGVTLVNEPKAFPARAGGLLKRSLRTMWHARGGGFYACGFVVTFVWLEVQTIAREIAGADGVVSFLSEQLLEFILRFSLQSLLNTVYALIWPALMLERYELTGVALLVIAWLLFQHVLKGPLTHWLFDGEPPPEPDDEERDRAQ